LVATSDRDDPDHDACRELLETSAPLVTTGLVIAEAAFLIARQVGPAGEAALVADVAEGRLNVEALTLADWARVHELVETYADLGLGTTDASVIALAERHQVTEVATLDQRHFRVVRPRPRRRVHAAPLTPPPAPTAAGLGHW
jgi:predicted nucleic acid-binding protein